MVNASKDNASLGAAYLSKGFVQKAKSKLLKALNQNPKNAYAHGIYGFLLGQVGNSVEAEKHFDISLQLAPNDSRVLNKYGVFLCESGKTKKAELSFLKATKDVFYPTPEYAYFNAGICVFDEQQYFSAINYFTQSLLKNKRYSANYFYRAESYLHQGEFEKAEADIVEYHKQVKKHNASLWLGHKIAEKTKNRHLMHEYAFKLKYRFPESKETQQLIKKENERKL